MHNKWIQKARRRRGSTVTVMIGVMLVILVFTMFFLELQRTFEYQYAIEVRAQRALNSCVESAMDDQYRADGYNYMNVNEARSTLVEFLREDLNLNNRNECRDSKGNLLYKVSFGNIEYHSGNPRKYCSYCGQQCRERASVSLDITVTMTAGLAKFYNITEYQNGTTWTNSYESNNFRTDY